MLRFLEESGRELRDDLMCLGLHLVCIGGGI